MAVFSQLQTETDGIALIGAELLEILRLGKPRPRGAVTGGRKVTGVM